MEEEDLGSCVHSFRVHSTHHKYTHITLLFPSSFSPSQGFLDHQCKIKPPSGPRLRQISLLVLSASEWIYCHHFYWWQPSFLWVGLSSSSLTLFRLRPHFLSPHSPWLLRLAILRPFQSLLLLSFFHWLIHICHTGFSFFLFLALWYFPYYLGAQLFI